MFHRRARVCKYKHQEQLNTSEMLHKNLAQLQCSESDIHVRKKTEIATSMKIPLK